MKTLTKLLTIPTAATTLASKIIGRVIDQVARGFDQDETLEHELCVYKAIQAKYPKDTISMPAMFKIMLRKAKTTTDEEYDTMLDGLDDAAKELWAADGASEKQALLDAMPRITEMFVAAEANLNAWKDMPTIAQWSLLNSMEAGIPDKVNLYKSWADTDRQNNKTATNAMRLQAEAESAIEPTYKLITAFLKTAKADLAVDAANGINVPPRYQQAA